VSDYNAQLKADLEAEADRRQLDRSAASTKADLVALLEANDDARDADAAVAQQNAEQAQAAAAVEGDQGVPAADAETTPAPAPYASDEDLQHRLDAAAGRGPAPITPDVEDVGGQQHDPDAQPEQE
jgi:hypothetical protein